jgi:O-antigen/teichoic acid export membrane protein
MHSAKNIDRKFSSRLIKGTTFNFFAVGFNQGSTLIANIVVANFLTLQSFGEYAMVCGTLLTLAALSQVATGYTASKYIAEYRSVDPKRASRIMGLCAITALIMASLSVLILYNIAPWLAGEILKAPHLSFHLIIGLGFLFFSVLNGYQLGALSGFEAFHSLAQAGFLSGITSITAISIGSWLNGFDGAVIGLSISALFRFLIHHRWLQFECRLLNIHPNYKCWYTQEKSIIYNFALPAAVAGYFSMPMIWLSSSFLVRQPNGYGEMGLYSAANNIRLIALFLPTVMSSVGLSMLNNEKGKGDIFYYNQLFWGNVKKIFVISFVSTIIFGLFGRYILHVFGENFTVGLSILWFLLIASFFESLSVAFYQYVQSQAKMWFSILFITIPRELTLVAAAYFLIPHFGGKGLSLALLGSTILGFFSHCSLVAYLYKKD